jgi:hypothetical protein
MFQAPSVSSCTLGAADPHTPKGTFYTRTDPASHAAVRELPVNSPEFGFYAKLRCRRSEAHTSLIRGRAAVRFTSIP